MGGGFFGNTFDLNHDGQLDALERAADFGLFVEIMEAEENADAEEDSDDCE